MQKLFDLFEEIGLPYFRQGSMSDEDYKPSFFTYWNIDTPNGSFYDNKEHRYVKYVQVGLYVYNDEAMLESQMNDFISRAKAKSKDFVVHGRAKDAPADKAQYYGKVCYIRIIHKTED